LQKNAAITVQGDSSMRLFDHADIDHPSFDPRNFLSSASNESVQPVEVAAATGQPYFMFVPSSLLKVHVRHFLFFYFFFFNICYLQCGLVWTMHVLPRNTITESFVHVLRFW